MAEAKPTPTPASVTPLISVKTDAPKPFDGKDHGVLRSRTPRLAHGGGAQGTYESHTSYKREWADGYVDYECAKPGCDFLKGPDGTDKDPANRVAAHFAAAHTRMEGKGQVKPGPITGVDPTWTVTPRIESRIKSLTREIQAAIDAAPKDANGEADVPAEWLAEYIINHRAVRESAAADAAAAMEAGEDLDDATIIDKIAALLDHGRGSVLRAEVDDLNSKFDTIQVVVDQLTADRDAAIKRADDAESNLKATSDMLADVVKKFGGNP